MCRLHTSTVEVHYLTVVARNDYASIAPRGSFIRVPTRNLITERVVTEKLSTRDRVYHRRTPGTAPGAKSLTAPVPFVRFLAPRNENTYFAIKTAPANTRASAIALRT